MNHCSLCVATLAIAAVGCGQGACPASPASASDHRVAASDGVEIVFTVFRPADVCADGPAPLILWNHGYPESRTDEIEDAQVYLDRGYAMVSIDQRGILGESGGVTSGAARPGIEDVDASLVLDWVHENLNWVEREPDSGIPRDLRVGAFGNGGGGHLSLMIAASDPRIDAVAPYVAYSSVLDDVFIPNEAVRAFWASVFLDFSFSLGVDFDPALFTDIRNAGENLVISDALRAVWRESDTTGFAANITAPVMFLHPLPDQITSGLRSPARTLEALGTDPASTWLVGMNAPFLDIGDNRGFGVGAPSRERPNQCAEIYTPGFADGGLGRFLDGELLFLFFDAFVKQDRAAARRLDRVPRVLLPVEQEGCVRGDAWPVADDVRAIELGEVAIPQVVGEAATFPVLTATEPTLVAGTVELDAIVPAGQDELFLATLVLRSGDDEYIVNDQVHGAQTGRLDGELSITLGTVVTLLQPGDELSIEILGDHFIYARAGGELTDPASLGEVVVRVPFADASLVGDAEVIE